MLDQDEIPSSRGDIVYEWEKKDIGFFRTRCIFVRLGALGRTLNKLSEEAICRGVCYGATLDKSQKARKP
jgi:hypothetical protein